MYIMTIAILLTAACASSCIWAQPGPARPALGQMIDRDRSLRPVYGVGGGFHVEAPVAERVLSSACSRTFCLAKTESALISAGVAIAAPPGDAKIGLDPTGATIYFSSIQQFGRWQNGALRMLSMNVYGTVLSLGSGSAGLTIAVERSGIVWIIAAGGTVLASLPPGAGPVLLTANGIVYATSMTLILRRGDGSELSFPATGVDDLVALGDGYVEARCGGILYALRTIPGRERIFQLPQPAREPSR
jgi:hypothetical protein